MKELKRNNLHETNHGGALELKMWVLNAEGLFSKLEKRPSTDEEKINLIGGLEWLQICMPPFLNCNQVLVFCFQG
ncbi:MAG: hypothetical protein INR73_23625 [Williamsia sp.]|nr:hypothetical protein [Williamsia sp.]